MIAIAVIALAIGLLALSAQRLPTHGPDTLLLRWGWALVVLAILLAVLTTNDVGLTHLAPTNCKRPQYCTSTPGTTYPSPWQPPVEG
jgi:hypothetical protein